MSLLNLSSLSKLFPVSAKKGSSKKSVSEKMNRTLALDSLEARVLLSVTPNTSYDVLVNTEYSTDQNTNANGNAVAVDADGDFVAVWTRGDNVYRDNLRNVGWTDGNGELHLYTDRNFVDGYYLDENNVRIDVNLTPYIDPNTNAPMVDYNIYGRYFTDEVQRVTFDVDPNNLASNDMLYDFTLQTGDTYVQKLHFNVADGNGANKPFFILQDYVLNYGEFGECEFHFSDYFSDPLNNCRGIQNGLEEIFGEGNVKVTAETALDYTVEFNTSELDGTYEDFQDLLMTCRPMTEVQDPETEEWDTVVDDEATASCHVEMLRQPLRVQVFVAYEKLYDKRDRFIGYGDIDVAATAEQIMVAFEQEIRRDIEGNVMNPSVDSYSPDSGPVTELNVTPRWNFKVSVVPVYGLGENIIGFDVTYVNSSGKQDMPELIVTEVNAVNKNFFAEEYADIVLAPGSGYRHDLGAEEIAKVHTLKQNSEEFRVNPTTDDVFNAKSKIFRATNQEDASVALDADGDFVVSWTSETLQTKVAGSFSDVYARTFSASMYSEYVAGADYGEEYRLLNDGKCYKATSGAILVNTTTSDPQYYSSVAMDRDGNFTVVWKEEAQEMSYRNGIYLQRFDAQGNKIGGEERVDTEVTGEAYFPQVAMSPDGLQIAVSWNWLNPVGESGVHMALYGYSTGEDNVTRFMRLTGDTHPQVGIGTMDEVPQASSLAFNKIGQLMIAWTNTGTDQFGAVSADTYVSQYRWDYTGKDLEHGTLQTLRDTYRVNSASMNPDSVTYWGGAHLNPSIGIDADGDFVVSYDGNGIDVSENFLPTEVVIKEHLSKFIAPGVNEDLLEYFNPELEEFVLEDRMVTWYIHGSQMNTIVTNGNVDSIIEAILAYAKKGLRDQNGDLRIYMEDTVDFNGVEHKAGEPIDPGCTMEQYGRLSMILHAVFDLSKGEGYGINFSMFDAAPNQQLEPGQVTILQSDNIANATRDGSDAKYYLQWSRSSYFGQGALGGNSYGDLYIRDNNDEIVRYYETEDGNLVPYSALNGAWMTTALDVVGGFREVIVVEEDGTRRPVVIDGKTVIVKMNAEGFWDLYLKGNDEIFKANIGGEDFNIIVKSEPNGTQGAYIDRDTPFENYKLVEEDEGEAAEGKEPKKVLRLYNGDVSVYPDSTFTIEESNGDRRFYRDKETTPFSIDGKRLRLGEGEDNTVYWDEPYEVNGKSVSIIRGADGVYYPYVEGGTFADDVFVKKDAAGKRYFFISNDVLLYGIENYADAANLRISVGQSGQLFLYGADKMVSYMFDANNELVTDDVELQFRQKSVNAEDFRFDHRRWQTIDFVVEWNGMVFPISVDVSECYTTPDHIAHETLVGPPGIAQKLDAALYAAFCDAWPRADGYEGCVEVRYLSQDDGDTTFTRALDGTPFDLNGRETAYPASMLCFEVQFSGILHDATVAIDPLQIAGTYYNNPTRHFDLNEVEGSYYRLVYQDGTQGAEGKVSEVFALPERNDGEDKLAYMNRVNGALSGNLGGFFGSIGLPEAYYAISIVDLVDENSNMDGLTEVRQVVEVTFFGENKPASVYITTAKPQQQGGGQGGQGEQKDEYPDWFEKCLRGYTVRSIFSNPMVGYPAYTGMGTATIRSMGETGTRQWASSLGMTPQGNSTIVWTQENGIVMSSEMVSSESIFFRAFDEEYDTVGPEVVEMYYGDGQKIKPNGQLERSPNEDDSSAKAVIVTFTENMMDWSKITTEQDITSIDAYKEHSVTNFDNWQIVKDGEVVDDAIIDIYFGMNASADPYIQNTYNGEIKAIQENKWEAVVVLNPEIDWGTGSYEILIFKDVQDANGNNLNSDGTNKDGSEWGSGFEIVAGSTETDILTPGREDADGNPVAPEQIDPETGEVINPGSVVTTDDDGNVVERDGEQQFIDVDNVSDIWSPTATATDPEGDRVTVWTSTETGYEGIYAKLDYLKWDNTDGRTAIDEGELTIKVTDNKTAQFASVDMAGDGDFVVTWSQNDATNPGGKDWNVWARMFDLNGKAKGEAFMVNSTTEDDQMYSQVAMSLAGDFVITWQGHTQETSWDIYAQRYDAEGNELGAVDEVQVLSFSRDFEGSFQLVVSDNLGNKKTTDWIEYGVNAYATKKALQEALDALGFENIEFTVTAKSLSQLYVAMHVTDDSDLNLPEMMYKLNNDMGTMMVQVYQDGRTGEFIVNETKENKQIHAAIDMDYEGNFVVSWTSYGSKLGPLQTEGGDDSYQSDIFARQFKSSTELGLISDVISSETFTATAGGANVQNPYYHQEHITWVDGTEELQSQQSGVAFINYVGNWTGSGVLLADGNYTYVLTAAHVVNGINKKTTEVSFYTTEGERVNAQVDEITIHEGYDGIYNDIALIKLTSSLKGLVTGYEINRDVTKDVGSVYTRYGFGTYGEGSVGSVNFEEFLMHTGKNKWEFAENGMLYDDFDDGTPEGNTLQTLMGIPSDLGLGDEETSSASGDSGGPCFVDGLIAGICHGGMSDDDEILELAKYGLIGMDIQVAYFANWIDNLTGAAQETIIGASGDEFRVNDIILGSQIWSDVALDADGDFVITWTSTEDGTVKGRDVYARRYDSEGMAVNNSFRVNTATNERQQISKVAMDAKGNFTIIWESFQEYNDGSMSGQPNNFGVYAQRYIENDLVGSGNYGNNGEIGIEYRINTFVEYDQRVPNVAMTAAGDTFFVWQGVDSLGADVEMPSWGIYSRNYYQGKDSIGPVVVRVQTECTVREVVGIDEDGNEIYQEHAPQTITVKNGDLIYGTIKDLVVTFDEQVLGQNPDEVNNHSMLSLSNIQLRKDGLVVTNKVIDSIECIGYPKTSEDYVGSNGNRIEKNIFRINFIEGVILEDGEYELTIMDNVQDIFGNNLDGDMDSEPGGKFVLGFEVTTDETKTGGQKPIAPEFEPKDPGDADAGKNDAIANSTRIDDQKEPAIAMNDNGDYVTVWVSEVTNTTVADDEEDGNADAIDTTGEEETVIKVVTRSVIMGQRFDRYGNKIGSEFFVSDFVDGLQTEPDVAMDMYGNFVVSWTVNGRDLNRDGRVDNNERACYDVYVRIYDASGAAVTPSFLVDRGINNDLLSMPKADEAGTPPTTTEVASLITTAGSQRHSSVAISPDCSQFVVTWTNVDSRVANTYAKEGITDKYGIFAQRFSISGEKIKSVFLVNSNPAYDQELSSVGMDEAHNIYVVWQSSNDSNMGLDVYARKFDDANNALTGDVLVNVSTRNDQKTPVIAVNDVGQSVIAWATQTGSGYDIAFRCFDSNLNAYGSETIANSYTLFSQVDPSVAITRKAANGTRFAISWDSYGQEDTSDKTLGVYMNVYDSLEMRNSVTTTHKEVIVNSYKNKDECASDLAMTAYGDIGIVWVGPSEAVTGDVVLGPTDTDIFHKVYYNTVLQDYVPLEDGVGSSLMSKLGTIPKYTTETERINGGGAVVKNAGNVVISTAKNANNKLVFQATNGVPSVTLNGVALDVTGANGNYTIDASNIGDNDCSVIVNGLGSERVTITGSSIVIEGSSYSLRITNATSFLFNGENVSTNLNVRYCDMLEVNGNSVALVSSDFSYRIEGCVNLSAVGSGSAIAKLTGTEEEENVSISTVKEGNKNVSLVKLEGQKLNVSLRKFAEVYLSGADNDSVVFANAGEVTVHDNVIDYVGPLKVHASNFAEVNVNASQGADIATVAGAQVNVVGSSLVVQSDLYTQTFTGLTMTSVNATMDGIEFGNATVSGFANMSVQKAGVLKIVGSNGDETLDADSSGVTYSNENYTFTADSFTAISIDGKGGNDVVSVTSASKESINFDEAGIRVGNGTIAIVNCANVDLRTNGAKLVAMASEDSGVYNLAQDAFTATDYGMNFTVKGAGNIEIEAVRGDHSMVALDSAGNDTFTLTPGKMNATVAGKSWKANGISNIKVYSVNGGTDTLTIQDTIGDDCAILSPRNVTMMNDMASVTAIGFANVKLQSSNGGNDSAILYDSVGDDVVKVANRQVSMSGDGFFNQISGFRKVNLYSINGGHDTADITGEFSALDEVFAIQDQDWIVKGIDFDF